MTPGARWLRRKGWITWTMGSLAVATILMIAVVGRRLPFELWQIHKLDSDDAEEREAALAALVTLRSERGAAAILAQLARSDSAPPPDAAGRFYFRRRDSFLRHEADEPLLQRLAWRDRCLAAMEELGSTAVAPLTRQLKSAQGESRRWAYWLLGHMEEHAASALPDLLRAFDDSDPEIRAHAAESAGSVARSMPAVLESCAKTLDDEERPYAQREANLRTLVSATRRSHGPDSSDLRANVWSHLLQAASSSDPQLRALALGSLIELDPSTSQAPTPDAGKLIRRSLMDSDAGVRELAVRHLRLVAPIRGETLAAFLELLEDESPSVRSAAAEQVEQLEAPLTREAFASLADFNADESDDSTRLQGRLDAEARLALSSADEDEIRGALEADDRASRVRAAVLLGYFTAHPESTFPALIRAADDADPTVQAEALTSASGVAAGREASLVQKAAEKLRSSPHVRVRRAAVRVLGEHSQLASEVLTALRQATAAEPNPGLRGELTRLVAAIEGSR